MSLLNKQNVRKRILERIKLTRPGWECTQVSPKAISFLELKFDAMIARAVHAHPTVGKTFKEIL